MPLPTGSAGGLEADLMLFHKIELTGLGGGELPILPFPINSVAQITDTCFASPPKRYCNHDLHFPKLYSAIK